jgi:hypothetical protein
LIAKFSPVCAFTGINHEAALEAAHLYRYSEHGIHRLSGGLLMRRDIHRLFDAGLIAVNGNSGLIDIHPELARYPEYASLEGKPLAVTVSKDQMHWLGIHWEQFR